MTAPNPYAPFVTSRAKQLPTPSAFNIRLQCQVETASAFLAFCFLPESKYKYLQIVHSLAFNLITEDIQKAVTNEFILANSSVVYSIYLNLRTMVLQWNVPLWRH